MKLSVRYIRIKTLPLTFFSSDIGIKKSLDTRTVVVPVFSVSAVSISVILRVLFARGLDVKPTTHDTTFSAGNQFPMTS